MINNIVIIRFGDCEEVVYINDQLLLSRGICCHGEFGGSLSEVLLSSLLKDNNLEIIELDYSERA